VRAGKVVLGAVAAGVWVRGAGGVEAVGAVFWLVALPAPASQIPTIAAHRATLDDKRNVTYPTSMVEDPSAGSS